ncbi:MAG TPA: hypothetical protein VFU02_12475, partial [Polyangiaceae bacterium]|nr:hypothetical protein [Polyangiaceae bacterium]
VLGVLLVSLVGCEARDCDEIKTVEYDDEEEKTEKEDGACIEFVSTKKWWGDTEQFNGEYESGKNVLIDSGNGSIVVRVTDRDDVLATFKPFVARAHDICDGEEPTSGDRCAAIDDDLADQQLIFEEEDGHYLIQSRRDDSVNSLGAEIEVELPSSFDGRLTVAQNNGSTDVNDVGDAAAVLVESQNGSCEIHTGRAPHIDINCKNGSTDVTIGAITPGNDVRQIFKASGDLGDLAIAFPSTDEPFSVSARSVGSDVLIDPASPSGCDVTGSDPRSVTVLCNGATNEDPIYTVRSDEDLVDIGLYF